MVKSWVHPGSRRLTTAKRAPGGEAAAITPMKTSTSEIAAKSTPVVLRATERTIHLRFSRAARDLPCQSPSPVEIGSEWTNLNWGDRYSKGLGSHHDEFCAVAEGHGIE